MFYLMTHKRFHLRLCGSMEENISFSDAQQILFTVIWKEENNLFNDAQQILFTVLWKEENILFNDAQQILFIWKEGRKYFI